MTLTQIRAHLRRLIDEPNTAKWSDANLNALINDATREIYGEIIRRNPMYLYKSGTVTTTASSYFTDIPTDCILLNRLVNSDGEILPRVDTTQMSMDGTAGEPEGFAVVGPHIHWYPMADAAYAITAYYHYMPDDMATDSSVPILPVGYHDILAYGAAIKCRTSKEDQIKEYIMLYGNKLELLLRAISVDQTNEAPRIKGAYHDFYLYD